MNKHHLKNARRTSFHFWENVPEIGAECLWAGAFPARLGAHTPRRKRPENVQ